jgi:hypothetical protein
LETLWKARVTSTKTLCNNVQCSTQAKVPQQALKKMTVHRVGHFQGELGPFIAIAAFETYTSIGHSIEGQSIFAASRKNQEFGLECFSMSSRSFARKRPVVLSKHLRVIYTALEQEPVRCSNVCLDRARDW